MDNVIQYGVYIFAFIGAMAVGAFIGYLKDKKDKNDDLF